MKAISLWQPWASLMAVHAKCIETRHWPTSYRGELAIHASKRKVKSELAEYAADDAFRNALYPDVEYFHSGLLGALPFGAIVCVVDLHDCKATEQLLKEVAAWVEVEKHFGNFSPGRFGWLTRNPKKLNVPVPCIGRQGFFNLPSEVEQQVRAQLPFA